MIASAATPAFHERFDMVIDAALKASPTRHTRDRLIAEVMSGQHDAQLLRAAEDFEAISRAGEVHAALNAIDFAFEGLILSGMSQSQAVHYCGSIRKTLRAVEVNGLEVPGPLWVDTVHHTCIFSVLFEFATQLRQIRALDRIILLHQGIRPEPRLAVVARLATEVLNVQPISLPMQGRWFSELAGAVTPRSLVFSLADMPTLAFPNLSPRRTSQLTLYAGDLRHHTSVTSGSSALAKRLGATHLVLDYPQPDQIRVVPFDHERPPTCPLIDWVFWPTLVAKTSSHRTQANAA